MATLTLRPNGVGNIDQWNPNVGASWECVDDVVSDDFTTYTFGDPNAGADFLCTIESNSIGASDTVNNISIYFRIWNNDGKSGNCNAIPLYRENSITSIGSNYASIATWGTFFQTFSVKGSNGTLFTKSDIDSLQIGLRTDQLVNETVICTQLYVIVDYTPAAGGTTAVKPIMMLLETDD